MNKNIDTMAQDWIEGRDKGDGCMVYSLKYVIQYLWFVNNVGHRP